ncbi:DUF4185 domain-containing protein, partial [Rhodococcus aetherivorans]
MAKVKDLTPTIGDVGGTDLGIPFVMPNGKVGFVLGDTFGGTQPWGPPITGLTNWRSPVILKSPTRDMAQPIAFDGACKGGAQLWPYQ